MIEFYHTHSEKRISYAEAMMYCFCLGDGWRLPTEQEYNSEEYIRIIKSFYVYDCTWHLDDPFKDEVEKYYAFPVRDNEIFKKLLDTLLEIKYNNYVN